MPTRDPDETYSEDYDEYEGEYEEDYEGDHYYDDSPARQPAFYIFIGLAALIGGGLIFLLFSLFGGNGDDPSVAAGFNVLIDEPPNNERVQIAAPADFVVRATSNEEISQFELFVADRSVDLVTASAPDADNVYSAVLHHTFDRVGEYSVFVRVTSISGATRDSDKQTVIAIQSVGDKPVEIKGRVVGTASIRRGPGESFPVIRTLNAGEEVTIVGKTRDSSWLLLADDDGWVRREAINPFDSLSLVPVKDPTPTPPPPTPVETATPSVTASPTTNPNAPDFVPTNALLIDGGDTLRITVQNLASSPYSGALVVGVSEVGVVAPQVVVDVNIPASGSVTVDFELDPPVSDAGSTVRVTVDPGNAIKESNEDNNSATFLLTPAVESPNLIVLAPSYEGATMNVTIRNDGGELKSSTVLVRVESGGSATEQSTTVALANGQSANFSFAKPSAGAAKIRVLVNGVQVSAVDIDVP
ncbi:MAG: CARDB domain-containing protein [Dehalococcoidia bacterium]